MAYDPKFKLRRQMALASITCGLFGFPILCCFKPELIALAAPYYLFVGAQLTHYQHLVTKHDLENKDNS